MYTVEEVEEIKVAEYDRGTKNGRDEGYDAGYHDATYDTTGSGGPLSHTPETIHAIAHKEYVHGLTMGYHDGYKDGYREGYADNEQRSD